MGDGEYLHRPFERRADRRDRLFVVGLVGRFFSRSGTVEGGMGMDMLSAVGG